VSGRLRDVRGQVDPRPVDILADLLAQVVHGQWRRAAVERVLVTPAPIPVRWSVSDLPVAGPVAAAVGDLDVAPAFPPLPGQARVTERQVRAGGGGVSCSRCTPGLARGEWWWSARRGRARAVPRSCYYSKLWRTATDLSTPGMGDRLGVEVPWRKRWC
jgi:hypothetical protein